ncbi:UNVERIFIED_CONTAM: Sphingosine-1-phosphate lyase [Sesamum latifolium]|uniref:Sphingosine-1-phosphate lyase n=1 Tax=Sesamum latifolium TaxID=2727402 RepID=A0AAW2UWI0_9LAMI
MMDSDEIISKLNRFRASANSVLSQYEPLALLLVPILTLLLARILQSVLRVVFEKGLKSAVLELFMASVKITPVSAHSAYDKAAHYFKIKLWRVPVDQDFRADVKAIKRHINRNTILIVGSAPGFPHGIIDPIEELGELASTYKICLHVDLCLGGFVLPFARKLGYPVPPFDFSVKGVTSISVDVHKYGLAPKGTSVVLYRDHEIRKHQFVAVTEWTGGLYISPTIAGSRPGGLIAGAWAAMMSLGLEGYLENTRKIMEASKRIEKGVRQIPELFVIGRPDMTIVAFGSNVVDIFEVNDIMSSKGWHLNALQRPNSIHICVTLQHVAVTEDFLKDLQDSVRTVKANPGPINGGLAPIYGAAGKMPDRAMVQDLLVDFMDSSC